MVLSAVYRAEGPSSHELVPLSSPPVMATHEQDQQKTFSWGGGEMHLGCKPVLEGVQAPA